MRKRTFSLFDAMCIAVMLLLIVATVYPFIYMIAVSFSEDVYVLKGQVSIWPKGFNVRMYEIVLTDPRIWSGYRNTVLYTVVGTAVSLSFTAMAAYALSKKNLLFHKQFTILIVVTMFFGGGMIPTFLVVKSLGLVDTFWAMIFPGAISTWYLIMMRTFFAGLPQEMEEAGKLDGLNEIGLFLRLVLPLSKAVLATIGLFYAVGIWNNFYTPLIYLRNPDLVPLQVILRNIVLSGQMDLNGNHGLGKDRQIIEESLKYATILVGTLPILVVYPFLQKYFVKGVTIGSLKG
ncbi:carbohydrate ABC transporter permease [Paenibacillus eucommiae]|uniref:Aldouronate transport system permease protein n=1 Tax=Paenibacillus eucommiae TaxID=1355755 RepID=A0ABS4IM07_9BACL|nr:carbohydrate ABC transporter permease [Paenibacillus eucommiae]MBP1988550.1 putative aldouronate transport system permease protein [Paenibacillus eucommiae]